MLADIRIASAVIKYRRLSQPLSLLSQQMCKGKVLTPSKYSDNAHANDETALKSLPFNHRHR